MNSFTPTPAPVSAALERAWDEKPMTGASSSRQRVRVKSLMTLEKGSHHHRVEQRRASVVRGDRTLRAGVSAVVGVDAGWLGPDCRGLPLAVSPGPIGTGAWDAPRDMREAFFQKKAETNPVGRIGTPEDVAQAVVLALTNTFMTGVTLPVDGGQRLVQPCPAS